MAIRRRSPGRALGTGGTINWGFFKRHFWGELLRHQHKPAENDAPPAAKPAENAALSPAKPAEDAALSAAKPAENAVPPAATMQLGAEDPRIASAADMPAQQQQFLSIISDFAQKYEAAPDDMAKDALREQRALRQQRARAICGIMNDLTVTNWVGTVNTLPGTDQGRGVLAVSLDKRS
ncbi:MAG TPA: hypothetical protein VKC66_13925, partial [Xanthobacteraceae bacterium]|nr:hypothetical protein [Xanthobacteraceae bacterium]